MRIVNKYWTLICTLLAVNLSLGQEYCVTPDQQNGECVPLVDCSYIYSQITNVLSPAQRRFLAKSQCGYKNGQVYICCEQQEVTTRKPTRVATPMRPPRPVSVGTKTSSLLPQPPNCGVSLKDRIVGGTVTGLDEYPWLAMLEYTKPGNKKGFHCGGSLISDRYILTAGHCVGGAGIPAGWRLTGVRLGEWNTTTDPDFVIGANGNIDYADPHVDIAVESIFSHPEYNPESRNQLNDIALLRLKRKVVFSDFVSPVCLPSQSHLRNELFTGRVVDVAGWGQTETSSSSSIKLKASLTVKSPEECQRAYSRQKINLEATQTCAGGVKDIDSCRGDSGGPLIIEETVNKNKYFFLMGVVSFGPNPCGLDGWPGVYTRVGPYIDWIVDTMQP